MYPPILVTAPVAKLVGLTDLKSHLRVDFDDDDDLIEALEASAVAHFDGWRGVLGRAIMPQTWSQDFDGWGDHFLAMPDATNISAIGILADVETAAITLSVKAKARGVCVTVDGGDAEVVRVTFNASLPPEQLPVVQMAVKLLVAHWYENRESVLVGSISSPLAFTVQALTAPLRTVSV